MTNLAIYSTLFLCAVGFFVAVWSIVSTFEADARSEYMPFRERYRHKKTGCIFEVICNATFASDDVLMVVYRDTETGECCVRPADEFYDGRFERVA